ncbi:lipid-A-disaccharide synthase-related protein [Geochorda subterranea]|uniref:Lipid-A-disaccharide synthase-related protein n=1 Tax=Geochorda subterranea TaxID=3109564 RepID=A0ABZ1BKR1_9FIRM|nr:lipid-A-disaccharide synthase-related protein [Limnochorda sp. LNt]WRP13421.1 lipid-A-disaccharide synthase-related protein [Limnochorda sp. LNt]
MPADQGRPAVLFLSNGHGEDAVGAAIARELSDTLPSARVLAAPIVGDGGPYRRLGIAVVTPTRPMPSGGFVGLKRSRALWHDLRAGLIRLHLRQARALRRWAPGVDLVVGVGDRLILYLARWVIRRPLVFVAIADSAYLTQGREISNPGERSLMRKCARVVFTRDHLSADMLRKYGVPAMFVGNPMMDAFDITGTRLGDARDGDPRPTVAILPGSRAEAYANFRLALDGVLCAFRAGLRHCRFVAAWADNLPVAPLSDALAGTQWCLVPAPGAFGEEEAWAVAHPDGATVTIVTHRFGDVISQATAVIGLAGTANEQAAGLGKPVILPRGTGPQLNDAMVRRQRLLLGEAVRAVEPNGAAIAGALRAVLDDPERYRRMSEVGRSRMGPRGGARRIAQAIAAQLTHGAGSPGTTPARDLHG